MLGRVNGTCPAKSDDFLVQLSLDQGQGKRDH